MKGTISLLISGEGKDTLAKATCNVPLKWPLQHPRVKQGGGAANFEMQWWSWQIWQRRQGDRQMIED